MDKNFNFSKYFKTILLKKLGVLLILAGVVLFFLGHKYLSVASIIIGIILIQFMKCPYCHTRLSGGALGNPRYCKNCCHELPKRKSSINKNEKL